MPQEFFASINTIRELGVELKRLRRKAGLTQPELAAQANVSVRWISRVENGHRRGEFERLFRVMHVLGLRISFERIPPQKEKI